MRYFFIIVLCLSITLTIYAQDTANTTLTTDDIPYIYYYSHALNGVVIERADGTDSRVIGQGLVEGNPLSIEGAGWSPNGDWFAWQDSEDTSFYYEQGYVAHIDGETQLDWMEDMGCVTDMLWHPTENLLLVLSDMSHSVCRYPYPIATYSLFDVDNQIRLGTFSLDTEVGVYTIPAIIWNEDNIQFLEATVNTTQRYPLQRFLITMSFDGNVTMESITEEQHFDNPFISNRTLDDRFSGRGTFFTWLGTDLEMPPTPLPNSGAVGGAVAASWSANEEWLLVGYEFCVAGCAGIPRNVNIYNPRTEYNREISVCGVDLACVNWLPEYVDISNLPIGQDYSVVPVPDSLNHHSETQTLIETPYAIFELWVTHEIVCEYGQNSAEVHTIETGEVDFVLPSNQHCGELENGVIEARPVIFALSPDEQYYALTDVSQFTALYHADTGNLITRLNFYGIQLSFSDDSADLITVGRFASATWDIQRLIEDYQQG